MSTRRKSTGRRSPNLGKIKFAFTAGALTMTMGLWVLFSNQSDQQALAQSAPDPQVLVDPNVSQALPPLSGSVSSTGANANGSSTISQFEQGFKLLLGGSQPVQSRPQITTRTRSSR